MNRKTQVMNLYGDEVGKVEMGPSISNSFYRRMVILRKV